MAPYAETALRNRLRDLNTKAYYLLVALGFIYGTSGGSGWLLKTALALTALAAVLPLQDLVKPVKPMPGLGRIRNFKITCLSAALLFTLCWIVTARPTNTATNGRFQIDAQDSMLAFDTKTGQLCRTSGPSAERPAPPLCSELK